MSDEQEETEVEFLDRYAEVAASLERVTVVEEDDNEEAQEIMLGKFLVYNFNFSTFPFPHDAYSHAFVLV